LLEILLINPKLVQDRVEKWRADGVPFEIQVSSLRGETRPPAR
jgi:hypothetical protein